MSDRTHISWADTTWPVTVGCDKVSPGCYDCYAMRDARRMESNPNPKISSVYSGLVTKQANGILNWTGTVKTLPERLGDPAHWKDHRDIFVCSQSDLFHEDVPGAFIGQIFSAIWNYSWHTYYILTKRPERLLELLQEDPPEGRRDFNATNFPHVIVGGESGKHARPMHPDWARSLRDQCLVSGTAYHFKQWGEWATMRPERGRPETCTLGGTTFYRIGRRRAGRVLDGQYWNARPGADDGPIYAPHPLHAEVTINESAGPEYTGVVGIITTIRPDNPAIREIDGEEANYWITAGGSSLPPAGF